jgi:ribosomal protein S18 acetylase RimI-like enzyme
MVIVREAKPADFNELINVYRREFGSGHILHTEDADSLAKSGVRYLVCVENGTVIGGMAMTKTIHANHSLAKFMHFAVLKDYKEARDTLLVEAEKNVGKGKIEIYVSERETPDIEFYMQHGYSIEGELTNHYSMSETCFVLGKTI